MGTIVYLQIALFMEKFEDWSKNVRVSGQVNMDKAILLAGQIADNWRDEEGLPIYNKTTGHGIKGYLRSLAIKYIHDTDKDMFDRMFPKGIPCLEIEVSESEEAMMLVDHGERSGLEQNEVYNAYKMLADRGFGESAIVTKLGNMLDIFSSNDLLNELRADLKKLTNKADRRSRQLRFRRNNSQVLEALTRLPACVEKAWLAHIVREEGSFNIPQATIKSLLKTFQEEKTNDENVSQLNPGEEFRKRWQEILNKADAKMQAAKDKEDGIESDKPKPWNKRDMATAIKRYASKVTKAIIAKCKGEDIDIGFVAAKDALYAKLDYVETHDPEDYAIFIEAVTESFDRLIEEKDKAVA